MTMVGFSLSFVIAEVIPLFLITLFTVIAYDLGSGDKAVWLIVSQFIAVGSIVPFVGPLIDLIGRKYVTLVSLCLVVVAMILLGTTQNIAGAIGAMAVSGISIGIQILTSIAAVTELVPTYKRGITIGYVVMGFLPFAPASLYGQLLAGKSWRYVGLIIGVLALVALVILAIWYRPPPRPNSIGLSKRQCLERMDFVGAFLGIGGITIFLVGLNWGGQDYQWHSVHVIATLTIGIASLVAFGFWEKFGAKYSMFPWRLAKHKRLFFAITILCLTSGINCKPHFYFKLLFCCWELGSCPRNFSSAVWPPVHSDRNANNSPLRHPSSNILDDPGIYCLWRFLPRGWGLSTPYRFLHCWRCCYQRRTDDCL